MIRNKLAAFFYGRNGVDGLYIGLFGLFLALWFIRFFITDNTINLIITVLQYAILLWALYRSLSRNLSKRRRENEVFMKYWRKVKGFFLLTKNRIRDSKSFRYRKCPHCGSVLRLPKRRGTHSVVCPRCNHRFDVSVHF